MKTAFVLTGLLILVVANILMFMRGRSEGFQEANNANANSNSNAPPMGGATRVREGFSSYALNTAAGTNADYKAMGAYDGVQLPTGNNSSVWRYTAPNEKLLGDEFTPGDDSLFMFKNNQCKPECCGASFSCGGGCVCTTPEQRQYIASRGGNRTAPEDSA
jgi:hypothetical protein